MLKKLRRILSVVLACAMLTGCTQGASPEASTGASNGETEAVVDYNRYSASRGGICYLDGAVIFHQFSILYQMDPTNPEVITPLCTRADCDHRDGACSAYVSTASIYVYDGLLYYLAQIDEDTNEYGLYSMKPGGKERTLLRSLKDIIPINQAFGIRYDVGDGYLILSVTKWKNEQQYDTIYLLDLEQLDTDPIFVYSNEADLTREVLFKKVMGNWAIYSIYAQETGTEQLFAYRIGTGETMTISADGAEILKFVLSGNTLYWCDLSGGLYATDLLTGEETTYTALNVPDWATDENCTYIASYDDRYLYLVADGLESDSEQAQAESCLTICDYEGNLKQVLSYEGLEDGLVYSFSTPDRVFFTTKKHTDLFPVCYFEKDAIEQGTAEFVWLEES